MRSWNCWMNKIVNSRKNVHAKYFPQLKNLEKLFVNWKNLKFFFCLRAYLPILNISLPIGEIGSWIHTLDILVGKIGISFFSPKSLRRVPGGYWMIRRCLRISKKCKILCHATFLSNSARSVFFYSSPELVSGWRERVFIYVFFLFCRTKTEDFNIFLL